MLFRSDNDNKLAGIFKLGHAGIIYSLGHVYSPTTVMISDAFYEKLPDDLKKAVIESFEEVRSIAREMAEKQDMELLSKLREKGMQINEIDRSAFQALMQPLYESFVEANGKEGAEFLQRIRDSLK